MQRIFNINSLECCAGPYYTDSVPTPCGQKYNSFNKIQQLHLLLLVKHSSRFTRNSFKNQQNKMQLQMFSSTKWRLWEWMLNPLTIQFKVVIVKVGPARLCDVGPGATLHCTSVQSHTCQELWSCAHKCAMWCVNPHRDEKGELPQHSRLDEFCCAQTKPPDSWQLCYQIPHSTHKSQMCLGTEKYNHSINGCKVFGVVYEVHKEQEMLPLV